MWTEFHSLARSMCRKLSYAHKEITKAQVGAIEALQKVISGLQNDVKLERERAFRFESPSRRNNLNFFSIPDIAEETFAKMTVFFATLWIKSLQLRTLRKFLSRELTEYEKRVRMANLDQLSPNLISSKLRQGLCFVQSCNPRWNKFWSVSGLPKGNC